MQIKLYICSCFLIDSYSMSINTIWHYCHLKYVVRFFIALHYFDDIAIVCGIIYSYIEIEISLCQSFHLFFIYIQFNLLLFIFSFDLQMIYNRSKRSSSSNRLVKCSIHKSYTIFRPDVNFHHWFLVSGIFIRI